MMDIRDISRELLDEICVLEVESELEQKLLVDETGFVSDECFFIKGTSGGKKILHYIFTCKIVFLIKKWFREKGLLIISGPHIDSNLSRAKVKCFDKFKTKVEVESEYFYKDTEEEAIIAATVWAGKYLLELPEVAPKKDLKRNRIKSEFPCLHCGTYYPGAGMTCLECRQTMEYVK